MSKRKDPKWKQERREKNRSQSNQIDWYETQQKHTSNEKQKAREIRHSQWWKNIISDGKCYYCGKKFSPEELTMDHKIPISRGGKSEKNNLVPACKECNNKKKYLLPIEWEEYISNLKNS